MRKIIFTILSIAVLITAFCVTSFGATQDWQTFTFTTDGQTIEDELGIAGITRIEAMFIVDEKYASELTFEENVDNGVVYMGNFTTIDSGAYIVDLRGLDVCVDVSTLSVVDVQLFRAIGEFTEDSAGEDETNNSIYDKCYDLLSHYIYGNDVSNPSIELTLTIASTLCCFAVVVIPFVLIYRVIRFMG